MTNAPLGVVLRHIHTQVDAESFAAESDGQLLERFTSRRDESAFASLMRRHGPMVFGVCRRILPRVHDTEDVFQATFLLLARKAGSIRKQESVGSWLHGVAYRLEVAGAIAFSPDGSLLAASGGAFSTGETRVRIWDVATWNALPALTAVMNALTGETPKQVFSGAFLGSWEMSIVPRIAFAPDGKTLAFNRWQKTIPVWEVASGKERLLLEGHQESTVWVAYAPDSRTLASASWDKTIRLWDLETGRELRCLTGHRGKANSLAFTADGNTLISAGDDSTILYWDVAAQTHRPVLTARSVTVKEIESFWNDLADPNAGKAYRVMISLWSSPAESITLLARHLQPATSVDLHRMNGLMADLDSKSFAVRSKATANLEQLDDLGVAALKKKLAENPSPEVRQRLKTILKSAEPWRSPALLRQIRAVEVLEKIGTPPARQLLQKLAAGAPAARLTKEAASAVGRLGKLN